MKKKIIIGVTVLVISLMGIYLLTRPKALGNINQVYNEATTSNSNISFSGQAGEKIKFSFRSNIEDGELEIILYDSDGNAVYELDQAKALETYFVLEKSDTYTLEAKYTNFIGDYKIAVYKVKRS